jgi:hypothetical protein
MRNDRIDEQVEKQVENYFRKTAPMPGSRLSSAEARERVRTAFAHQTELSRRTREVLGTEPVWPMDYSKYMCFTREVDRLVRFYGGSHIAETELKIVLFKYSTWGCSEPILRKLMAEMFGIPGESSAGR